MYVCMYVCMYVYIYGYIVNIIIYTYYMLWMLRSDPWTIVSSKFHWARYCKVAKSCHSLPTWVYQSYPKLEDPKTAPGLSRSSGCGYRHCLGTARSGDKNRMNYVFGLYTRISIYIYIYLNHNSITRIMFLVSIYILEYYGLYSLI